jgi:(p)ppGpp synthase/HD superfamily hydrolase
MSLVSEALVFATSHHQHQVRKGTKIPYMNHLLNVCRILAEYNCADEILAAALLHDIVEDTDVTIEEIEQRFGVRVASIVKACTEEIKQSKEGFDKIATWRTRKESTLEFISSRATCDDLLVIAADKLDNLRSMVHDHSHAGEGLWKRFNASKPDNAWYYDSVAETLLARAEHNNTILKTLASEMLVLNSELFHEPVF